MTGKLKEKGAQTSSSAPDTGTEVHEKVPEGAENMEHTLRRLNAEKEKRRKKDPGLYY